MNTRCLTYQEVCALLQHLVDKQPISDQYLADIIESARNGESSIVCHTLFVAWHITTSERGHDKLNALYSMTQESTLDLQDGGEKSIEYLLHHKRNPEETLEEALVLIQERLNTHDYKHAIRY